MNLLITHFCFPLVPELVFQLQTIWTSRLSVGLHLRLVHVLWYLLKDFFGHARCLWERHYIALQLGIFTESVVSHCCESAAVIEYDLCEQIVVECLLPNLYDTRRQRDLFEIASAEAPFSNVT